MPRNVPENLVELLANPRVESHSTLDLIYSDASATTRRWSTIDFVDGLFQHYTPYLKKIGDIKQSISRATDRVRVEVINNDNVAGLDVASDLGYFAFAEAIVGRWYRADNTATTHKSELFRGRVMQPEVTERLVTFDIVDSLTARGPVIASRPLTIKCPFRFKDPRTCTYAGAETTCNKMPLSSDGCRGRDNLPHFGGWYFSYPMTSSAPDGSGLGGSGGGLDDGDGSGKGGCFAGDTLVTMADGSEKPIRYVRPGEWVLCFYWDERSRQNVVTVDRVEKVFPRETYEYYRFTLDDGTFIDVTGEHPIYVEKGAFRHAEHTQLKQRFGVLDASLPGTLGIDQRRVVAMKLFESKEPVPVYDINVRHIHSYFANRVGVHNKIPIYDTGGYGT